MEEKSIYATFLANVFGKKHNQQGSCWRFKFQNLSCVNFLYHLANLMNLPIAYKIEVLENETRWISILRHINGLWGLSTPINTIFKSSDVYYASIV
jgi:hypothetical protein